jgi:hypothetical protein
MFGRLRVPSMPLDNAPDWWSFELELSPHVEERMIDRGFTEVDPRLMIETAETIRTRSDQRPVDRGDRTRRRFVGSDRRAR